MAKVHGHKIVQCSCNINMTKLKFKLNGENIKTDNRKLSRLLILHVREKKFNLLDDCRKIQEFALFADFYLYY